MFEALICQNLFSDSNPFVHAFDNFEEEMLTVFKQTSLAEETVKDNQTIHVVVKNIPFEISLKLSDQANCKFNDFNIDVNLVYDCEQEKSVSYIKHKPLEYSSQIKGNIMHFEVKVKVLTSQMEDMFFQLQFTTKSDRLGGITKLRSAPFKVVSKPHQIRSSKNSKKLLQNFHSHSRDLSPSSLSNLFDTRSQSSPDQTSSDDSVDCKPANRKKRDRSHIVSDNLQHIQQVQQNQQEILNQLSNGLLSMKSYYENIISQLHSKNNQIETQKIQVKNEFSNHKLNNEFHSEKQEIKNNDNNNNNNIEDSFDRLLKLFNQSSHNERATKIRKIVTDSDTSNCQLLAEIGDLFEHELECDNNRGFASSLENINSNSNTNSTHYFENCVHLYDNSFNQCENFIERIDDVFLQQLMTF